MTDFKSIPWWRLGRGLRAAREVDQAMVEFGRALDRTLVQLGGIEDEAERQPTKPRRFELSADAG